jgi:Ca-activated chloride channel family protein
VVADPLIAAAVAAAFAALVAVGAELLHFVRVVRAAPLAFGPRRTLFALAVVAPVLRVAAATGLVWGLVVLATIKPMTHNTGEVKDADYRHLVLVLDVSPSMQLEDAGPSGKQKRAERAADLIQSFFERVQAERYKTTIVAFWTDAKPVVKDTADREVIRNILTELPMRHAFKPGETNIFGGLERAAEIAKPWPPGTAILMCVTDGDTVPATGMPKMPASIGTNVVMVGVGNPAVGKSIEGHMSRQDTSTLRQVATRLNGTYHDGNDKQLTTELVSRIDERATPKREEEVSNRDLGLIFVTAGASVLALLPLALTLIGTGWHPGRHPWQARSGFGVPRRVE